MKSLKSHLIFNRSQRSGILFLIVLITVLIVINVFYDFSEDDIFDTSTTQIKMIQKELDSLRLVEIESRKPKVYPFNPNFLTDHRAYMLGVSAEEYDRLVVFRSRDRWINSKEDFQRVTKISDSLLEKISPYFKFPKWLNKDKPKKRISYKYGLSYDQKIDLNTATELELQKVNGIGEILSKRIVSYRKQLDGFTADIQLYEVWGLEETVVKRTLELYTVKTAKNIEKINLNTASASDIATIPGVSFELAKRIWEFRRLREHLSDFSELEKIEGLSSGKLKLIQLYLSIE